MTLSEFETILESLDPGRDTIRLMGGEPTRHTRYPQIIKMVKQRRYQVVVFTNGLHAVLRETTPDLPDKVLLNLNDWSTYTTEQQNAIQDNLSVLRERIGLAYTILHPVFDLSIHRQLILKYGLQPVIRLGLAQPVIGGDNAYLPDKDLPAAHHAVVEWAKALSTDGIRLSMDCGFMRCQYNDDDIERLVRAGTILSFHCSPTLDVSPGLRVWRCFAFSSNPGLFWSDFENPEQMQAWFKAEDDKRLGACKNCEYYLKGWCHGGCLARQVTRFAMHTTAQEQEMNINNIGIEAL
jgi:radical SAM protein with 4Fe4S-binding SPASM domain